MNINLDIHKEDNHATSKAKYVKNIIFGGLDGIITTFSIIAAAYGADFSNKLIIIMGIANLVADAVSMGLGDFLSSYYENLYILTEEQKERYEYINNNEYEIKEMIELYVKEGIDQEDATTIVNIISKPKYEDYFIKTMVNYELDLNIPGSNFKNENIKEGLITFVSFMIFGFIPVLTYIIFYSIGEENKNNIFITTCFITCIAMYSLGYFQAKITKQIGWKYGFMMLINGSLAASCAFSIGYGLENIMN